MITIFFELPYERQLRRLYSAAMDVMFKQIGELVKQNGGTQFYEQKVNAFCFDESVLAYVFSAVRFLAATQKILKSKDEIIKEYRFLIDCCDNKSSQDELLEIFTNLKKQWVPDDGFFLTTTASQLLKKYVSYEKISGENLYHIVEFLITAKVISTVEPKLPTSFLVVHSGDYSSSVLYNFILQNPIEDKYLKILTESEKYDFQQMKASHEFLKKHRFEKNFPQYFTDAFLLYVSIYFKLYQYQNKTKSPTIYSADLRNTEVSTEVDKILSVIPNADVKELPKSIQLVSEFPEDLLQAIFLLMTVSKYLFIDEIDDFFSSIGKDNSFLNDIYEWLYKNELIFEQRNIFTRSTYLLDIIETAINKNAKGLKQKIGNFILTKYNKGEIYPSETIIKVLENLTIPADDEIKVSIFLSQNSNNEIANFDLKKFAASQFYGALQHFQKAVNTENNEIKSVAFQSAKQTITTFQQKKLEVGEYRSMLLLGLLNLREKRIPDAISYFSYALDIAKHMQNSDLICEALFNMGATYFLQNDLKTALTFFYKMSDVIDSSLEESWKIKCLFMQGRIFFEIGEYNTAEKFFLKATDFSKSYYPELSSICEIWYARSLLNLGQSVGARRLIESNLDKNFDASIFFLELLLFNVVITDESVKLLPENVDEKIHPTELADVIINNLESLEPSQNSDFISGYSLAEDLIWKDIYGKPMKVKVFTAFYTYYKFKVELSFASKLKSSANTPKKLLQALSQIANEALNCKDPYAHVYLYLCYDASAKLNGESVVETTGYLSKAFKALQYRLMPISENDIRDKFMKSNSWNSKLFSVAQQHKLV